MTVTGAPREANLSSVFEETDDSLRSRDEVVLDLARPFVRPVRLLAEERVDGVRIHPLPVVVQFVAVGKFSDHR